MSWLDGIVGDINLKLDGEYRDLDVKLPKNFGLVAIDGNGAEFKRLEVRGCFICYICNSTIKGDVIINYTKEPVGDIIGADIHIHRVTIDGGSITVIGSKSMPNVELYKCKGLLRNLTFVSLLDYNDMDKSLDLTIDNCDLAVYGEVKVVDSIGKVGNSSYVRGLFRFENERYVLEHDDSYNHILKIGRDDRVIGLGCSSRDTSVLLYVNSQRRVKVADCYGDYYGVDITKLDLSECFYKHCRIKLAKKGEFTLNRLLKKAYVSEEFEKLLEENDEITLEIEFDDRDVNAMEQVVGKYGGGVEGYIQELLYKLIRNNNKSGMAKVVEIRVVTNLEEIKVFTKLDRYYIGNKFKFLIAFKVDLETGELEVI